MMPKRSPARTSAPGCHAADDAARQHADDLPGDDRLAAVIDPDLAALVRRARVVPVRRQEPAGRERHPRHAPDAGMRLTCTSIGDRKMLICCHDPGGADSATAGAGDQHAAVGRRQHRLVV